MVSIAKTYCWIECVSCIIEYGDEIPDVDVIVPVGPFGEGNGP